MKEIYSFKDDYSEGAHPRILEALQKYNAGQVDGYGNDPFCQKAIDLIRLKLNQPEATIHFVSGGTQANMLVLGSLLRPHESVLSASSAHIAVHETGSVEATGHKIHLISSTDGKLTPGMIGDVLGCHRNEHMVKPRVVFISQTTEMGTIYTKKELTELSMYCRANHLILYLDGARLAAALTAKTNNITLSEIARLVDVFYIGGTKNGAIMGEAIVFPQGGLIPEFRYMMKQKGALLAKGRIFGIQFTELFKKDLYLELGRRANFHGNRLAEGIDSAGYCFFSPPVSNQIFPIFPDTLIEDLQKKFGFHVWQAIDDKTSVVRLVTSWATDEIAINQFLKAIG